MKKTSQLKLGIIISYITMGAGLVIQLAYTPIMLRTLGQSEYGLYNVVASIVSYLSLLGFGFNSSYIRFFSKYNASNQKKEINKLNAMFLTIFTVVGVITFVVGMFLRQNSTLVFGDKLQLDEIERAKVLMVFLVVNMSISFPASVFSSYAMANERYAWTKFLQLARIVTGPFLTLPILLLGYGSIGMVAVTVAVNLAIELINVIYCLYKLKIKFIFKFDNLKLFKSIASFSAFIFVTMIVDQINWNVDKYILGRTTGTIAVAIYSAAAQLNSYYKVISTNISSVFTPRIHRLAEEGKEGDNKLTHLMTKVGRIQFIFICIIFIGFIFFGKEFIRIWAGDNYSNSYYIALVLLFIEIPPLIQNIAIEITRAKEKQKIPMLITICMALINIALSIPLSKTMEGLGCAIGTATSLLFGTIAKNIYYHKELDIDLKYFWKDILKLLKGFILPTIYCIVVACFLNIRGIAQLVIAGSIYVIIYMFSIFFFGMNQYEKDLIKKPINFILARIRKPKSI